MIHWEALNQVVVVPTVSSETVEANGSDTVTVTWNSPNADSCSHDGNGYGNSGSLTFGPYLYNDAGTKSATISCANRLGPASGVATWTVEAPEPEVVVSLSPDTVPEDTGASTLTWSSTYADSCSRDGTAVSTSGSERVGPYDEPGTYTFTISCTGTGGTTSESATLTVEPVTSGPTVTVNLNPPRVLAGSGTAMLSWNGTDVTSCTRDGSAVPANGSVTVGPYPAGSRDFTVNCAGPGGSASGTATLTAVPPPTVSVSADPTTVTADEGSVVLTWSSTDTVSCEYGADTLGTGGTRTVGPFSKGSHTLTVNCMGEISGETASGSVTITAITTPPPTDTDGDGIPDSEDTDDDNDGIPDLWELGTGLDPLDASDARWDEDNDGYNNLAEYNAGTDPNWADSHPMSIPAHSFGFNDNFVVEKGRINGDALEDMLIRDPTPGILPGISDFVLIKRAAGGFDLRDADDYTIANPLTDISSVAAVADINGDGSKDLILVGLDAHFPGANETSFTACGPPTLARTG